MSEVLWAQAVIPPLSQEPVPFRPNGYDHVCIPGTRMFSVNVDQALDLRDRRILRSMSRAAILLFLGCQRATPLISKAIEEDPFSVGIYCAVNHGAVDPALLREIKGIDPEDWTNLYRKTLNPKHYFRFLSNIPPAILAIHWNCMGPSMLFQSSRYGVLHALRQAEEDLAQGVVKRAVVCASFAMEVPMLVSSEKLQMPSAEVLSEGAGCLVLGPEKEYRNWPQRDHRQPVHFGIATDLISWIQEEGTIHEWKSG